MDDDENCKELCKEGMKILASGETDKALHYFVKLSLEYSNSPIPLDCLGYVLVTMKQYVKAITAFDRAIQLDPEYIEALCNKAISLYFLGKFDEAKEIIDKAIEKDPKDPLALCDRALICSRMGLIHQALDDLRVSIELDPENPIHYINRGAIYLGTKFFEAALIDFNKALSLNPAEMSKEYAQEMKIAALKALGYSGEEKNKYN